MPTGKNIGEDQIISAIEKLSSRTKGKSGEINYSIKVEGVKELEKANDQIEKFQQLNKNSRGNYFASEAKTLDELTKAYTKYTEAKTDSDKNAARGGVVRWANAYRARGGFDQSKIPQEIISTVDVLEQELNGTSGKGFVNYSVDSFKELFGVMEQMEASGVNMAKYSKNYAASVVSSVKEVKQKVADKPIFTEEMIFNSDVVQQRIKQLEKGISEIYDTYSEDGSKYADKDISKSIARNYVKGVDLLSMYYEKYNELFPDRDEKLVPDHFYDFYDQIIGRGREGDIDAIPPLFKFDQATLEKEWTNSYKRTMKKAEQSLIAAQNGEYIKKSDEEIYASAMEMASSRETIFEKMAENEANVAKRMSGTEKQLYEEMSKDTAKLVSDDVQDGQIEEKMATTSKLINGLQSRIEQETDPAILSSLNEQLDNAKVKMLAMQELFKDLKPLYGSHHFSDKDISSEIIEKYKSGEIKKPSDEKKDIDQQVDVLNAEATAADNATKSNERLNEARKLSRESLKQKLVSDKQILKNDETSKTEEVIDTRVQQSEQESHVAENRANALREEATAAGEAANANRELSQARKEADKQEEQREKTTAELYDENKSPLGKKAGNLSQLKEQYQLLKLINQSIEQWDTTNNGAVFAPMKGSREELQKYKDELLELNPQLQQVADRTTSIKPSEFKQMFGSSFPSLDSLEESYDRIHALQQKIQDAGPNVTSDRKQGWIADLEREKQAFIDMYDAYNKMSNGAMDVDVPGRKNITDMREYYASLKNEIKEVNEEVRNTVNQSPISSGTTALPEQEREVGQAVQQMGEQIAQGQIKAQNEIQNTTDLLHDLSELMHNLSGKNLRSFDETHGGYFGLNDNNFDSTLEHLKDVKQVIKKLTRQDVSKGDNKLLSMGINEDSYNSILRKAPLLEKLGYTISEIRESGMGYEADIIPIPDKAITNGKEMAKILFDIKDQSEHIISSHNEHPVLSGAATLPSQVESISDLVKPFSQVEDSANSASAAVENLRDKILAVLNSNEVNSNDIAKLLGVDSKKFASKYTGLVFQNLSKEQMADRILEMYGEPNETPVSTTTLPEQEREAGQAGQQMGEQIAEGASTATSSFEELKNVILEIINLGGGDFSKLSNFGLDADAVKRYYDNYLSASSTKLSDEDKAYKLAAKFTNDEIPLGITKEQLIQSINTIRENNQGMTHDLSVEEYIKQSIGQFYKGSNVVSTPFESIHDLTSRMDTSINTESFTHLATIVHDVDAFAQTLYDYASGIIDKAQATEQIISNTKLNTKLNETPVSTEPSSSADQSAQSHEAAAAAAEHHAEAAQRAAEAESQAPAQPDTSGTEAQVAANEREAESAQAAAEAEKTKGEAAQAANAASGATVSGTTTDTTLSLGKTTGDTSAESSNMGTLQSSVEGVTSAVEAKTNAFTNEQSTVANVISSEIDSINQLQQALSGIGESIAALDDFFTTLGENTGFSNMFKDISQNADALKAFSDILKATKEQQEQAMDSANLAKDAVVSEEAIDPSRWKEYLKGYDDLKTSLGDIVDIRKQIRVSEKDDQKYVSYSIKGANGSAIIGQNGRLLRSNTDYDMSLTAQKEQTKLDYSNAINSIKAYGEAVSKVNDLQTDLLQGKTVNDDQMASAFDSVTKSAEEAAKAIAKIIDLKDKGLISEKQFQDADKVADSAEKRITDSETRLINARNDARYQDQIDIIQKAIEAKNEYNKMLTDDALDRSTLSENQRLGITAAVEETAKQADIAIAKLKEMEQLGQVSAKQMETANAKYTDSKMGTKQSKDALESALTKQQQRRDAIWDEAETSKINEATKAINEYYEAAQKVVSLQGRLTSGENVGRSLSNAIAKMNEKQAGAEKGMTDLYNLSNMGSQKTPDSVLRGYKEQLDYVKQIREEMSNTGDQTLGFENINKGYDTLIRNAERYAKISEKQRVKSPLSFNELSFINKYGQYYKDAEEGVNLFADAQAKAAEKQQQFNDAMNQANTNVVGDRFENLGKSISKIGEMQLTNTGIEKLNEIDAMYNQLSSSVANYGNMSQQEQEQVVASLDNVLNKIKEIDQNSSKYTMADQTSISKLNRRMAEWMNNNTAASSLFPEIQSLVGQNQLGISTDELKSISAAFDDIIAKANEARMTGKSFGDALSGSFRNLARYMMSFASVYRVIGTLKQAVNIVKEMDTALTEVRKVSSESLSDLKDWQKSTFDQADAVGGNAKQLQDSTASWLRLGKSFQEAQEASQASVKLLNTTEFTNIDDATTSLLSITQAYKELTYEDVIDKLNNIGDHFSSSSSDLAKGLQNAAAVLKTQGNDIDQALALMTAGNDITQDISKTSAGIRTISLRISGTEEAKNEIADMGEDVDDFVVQTKSKTDQIIRDYTAVASNSYKGISVLDQNGNLRSTYDINKCVHTWETRMIA